jgi:benzoylformate decarboxylase
MLDQLAASEVKFVFNNPGSLEAAFFDSLHADPRVHGIVALHETSVISMAGGYTQAKLEPAVAVVHLGAGLAQGLGQMINLWYGGLPVVVITFANDTGSYGDRVGLNLGHDSGPATISTPFTKASWTVIEPEGLPNAIARALRVAMTDPVGPVHVAVYERVLWTPKATADIIEGPIPRIKAGQPLSSDIDELVRALDEAERPLFNIGDGVWKSGAREEVIWLAEHFGAAIAGDTRGVPMVHRLHCGRSNEAVDVLAPDLVVNLGLRNLNFGAPSDLDAYSSVGKILAVGADVENVSKLPVDHAILADVGGTIRAVQESVQGQERPERYASRLDWAHEQADSLRATRSAKGRAVAQDPSRVRPWRLAQAVDDAVERAGGGLVLTEQHVLPLDSVADKSMPTSTEYVGAAGGSEGYGVGGAVGLKLAALDRHVVGLVGDGSVMFADNGLRSAAHHQVPVLYVVPNNGSYGVVAQYMDFAGGVMNDTREYSGVALDDIDIVKVAEGMGVEGVEVQQEEGLVEAIVNGLELVDREQRPFLMNVHLPLGLPAGGRAAPPFRPSDLAPGSS